MIINNNKDDLKILSTNIDFLQDNARYYSRYTYQIPYSISRIGLKIICIIPNALILHNCELLILTN